MTNVVFPHPPGAVTRSGDSSFPSFNNIVFDSFNGSSSPTINFGGGGTEHNTPAPTAFFSKQIFLSSNKSLLMCTCIATLQKLSIASFSLLSSPPYLVLKAHCHRLIFKHSQMHSSAFFI
ncbi:hypothetical protein ACB094_03G092800 [Castanea mollissima]